MRVHRTGRKTYVVQTRGPNGLKRVTIGRHGDTAAEQARKEAAAIIDRIKRGMDPVPSAPVPELTVADLAERCLSAHAEVNCRPKTVELYRHAIYSYIVPELGSLAIGAVDRAQVTALHYKLHDKPYQANHVVNVLSKMLSPAEAWGLVPPGGSPCRSVRMYKKHKRERFLTEDEYRRLGRVLDKAEADGSVWPYSIHAIRLLVLTGCRRNEIATLRWDDVDRTARELRLRNSKTGARMIPLTPTVEDVLAGIARVPGNPWVIAGGKPGAHLSNVDEAWRRLRARAGLDDVRIHDLQHSFASRALALGESLPVIGKLLGHAQVETTARYAHLTRDSVRESAARIAASIGADLLNDSVRSDA